MSRLTLAQQIAQLEDTAPDVDPEDAYCNVHPTGGAHADENLEIEESARAHYLEVGPSALRKFRESAPDPKYNAVKTHRNKIFDDDDDDGDDLENPREQPDLAAFLDPGDDVSDASNVAESSAEDNLYPQSIPFGEVNEDASAVEDEDDEDDEEDSTDEDDAERIDTEPLEKGENGFATKKSTQEDAQLAEMLRNNHTQDALKGAAIMKQQLLWDSLLDARIRLQKSAVAANRLPLPDHMEPFCREGAPREAIRNLVEASLKLSDDLIQLQEVLLTSNGDVQPPPRKRRKLDPDESQASQVKQASLVQAAIDACWHQSMLQTLAKWSNKVQAAGSVKTFNGMQQKGAIELLQETLSGSAGVSRTRLRRAGEGQRLGVDGDSVDGAEEIFDDADFYQTLLRDVIDSRTNNGHLASLDAADAWRRKQKKAQKGERALANKDRRVRYDVHEKLVNFMVPIPSACRWHEEQVDELCSSLLGKGFEAGRTVAVSPSATKDPFEKVAGGDLGGLRIV